jgi:hypothetical protein
MIGRRRRGAMELERIAKFSWALDTISQSAGGPRRSPAIGGGEMAKSRKRRYSRSAGSDVKSEMERYKRGTARSGRGGKGGKIKSRKQAIAIGLSKARKKGKKVPRKKSA